MNLIGLVRLKDMIIMDGMLCRERLKRLGSPNTRKYYSTEELRGRVEIGRTNLPVISSTTTMKSIIKKHLQL